MYFNIESHNCAAFAVSQQLWDSNNWSWSNERPGWWLSQFPSFFSAIKRRRSSSHEKTHNLATETDPHSGHSEKRTVALKLKTYLWWRCAYILTWLPDILMKPLTTPKRSFLCWTWLHGRQNKTVITVVSHLELKYSLKVDGVYCMVVFRKAPAKTDKAC